MERPSPHDVTEAHAYLRELLAQLEDAPTTALAVELRDFLTRHFAVEEGPGGLFALVREHVPSHAAAVAALTIEHRDLLAEATALATPSSEIPRDRVAALVEALRAHEQHEGRILSDAVDTMIEGGSAMNDENELDTTKPFATLTCGDLMSGPVRVAKADATLGDVHSLMKLAGFRHVPIVDDAGKLVGVVSDRDVHLAWHEGPDTLVTSFMSRATQWAHPEATARDVTARMLNDHIGCMPVVDADGKPVGIVTESDLLRVAYRALTIQEALSD